MPRYDYACQNPECGSRFELVQSFTDPAATECPVCGHRVRKVYGSVGVVFKGSGFYRTDSRAGADGSKNGGGKSGGDGAAKSDAPAAGSSSSSNSSSKSGSNSSGSGAGGSSSSTSTGSPSKPAAAS